MERLALCLIQNDLAFGGVRVPLYYAVAKVRIMVRKRVMSRMKP